MKKWYDEEYEFDITQPSGQTIVLLYFPAPYRRFGSRRNEKKNQK